MVSYYKQWTMTAESKEILNLIGYSTHELHFLNFFCCWICFLPSYLSPQFHIHRAWIFFNGYFPAIRTVWHTLATKITFAASLKIPHELLFTLKTFGSTYRTHNFVHWFIEATFSIIILLMTVHVYKGNYNITPH